MNTVTIGVSTFEETMKQVAGAFSGEPQGQRLSFATMQLLWKTLTPRRWEMLRLMTGRGAMSLRAIARLTERDVKTVHGDVHTLMQAGVLERDENGGIVFPYDAIHVDFTITAAA